MKEKIGQLIMVGVAGEELTADERGLLGEYPFGGFILFGHNLREPAQIVSLARSLWETASGLPPLIAIDQEGGRVHRLPPPFTHFPSAAVLGRTQNTELAYDAGLATARELSAVGINLNFAPVLDVHSHHAHPVIGDRALAAEPDEVIRLGWEIVRGLREGGVIPCVKHFPGHGGTAKDSHVELPVVEKEIEQLQTTELAPFAHACRSRVEAVMTAHVLYPALDRNFPATLSPRIVGDLLRAELRYDGVVFSDDLEMQAVSGRYTVEDAARLATLAGIDVLLFCHDTARAVAAFEFLLRASERDGELRVRLEESHRRVQRLKKRYLRKFTADERDLDDCLNRHRTLAAQIENHAS